LLKFAFDLNLTVRIFIDTVFHEQKKLQQAVEWPIKHAAAFSRFGISPVRGILLHGPPGCSKTTLAKAAAHAAQASFFSLRF